MLNISRTQHPRRGGKGFGVVDGNRQAANGDRYDPFHQYHLPRSSHTLPSRVYFKLFSPLISEIEPPLQAEAGALVQPSPLSRTIHVISADIRNSSDEVARVSLLSPAPDAIGDLCCSSVPLFLNPFFFLLCPISVSHPFHRFHRKLTDVSRIPPCNHCSPGGPLPRSRYRMLPYT